MSYGFLFWKCTCRLAEAGTAITHSEDPCTYWCALAMTFGPSLATVVVSSCCAAVTELCCALPAQTLHWTGSKMFKLSLLWQFYKLACSSAPINMAAAAFACCQRRRERILGTNASDPPLNTVSCSQATTGYQFIYTIASCFTSDYGTSLKE